ncbi:MAG: hypothetical protein NTY22_08035 [Proteobacteria bacterium]|nr:hypothetical protein [Pseudomonadota bacterium]
MQLSKIIFIVVLGLLSSPIYADNLIPLDSMKVDNEAVVVGRGYNGLTVELAPFTCTEKAPLPVAYLDAVAPNGTEFEFSISNEFTQIESYEQLSKTIDFNSSFFKAISVSVYKALSSNSESKIYHYVLTIGRQRTSDGSIFTLPIEKIDMILNGNIIKFNNHCGTEFINSILEGYKIDAILIVKNSATTSNTKSGADIDLSKVLTAIAGTGVSEEIKSFIEANLKLKMGKNNISKDATVELHINFTPSSLESLLPSTDKNETKTVKNIPTGDYFFSTVNTMNGFINLVTEKFPEFVAKDIKERGTKSFSPIAIKTKDYEDILTSEAEQYAVFSYYSLYKESLKKIADLRSQVEVTADALKALGPKQNIRKQDHMIDSLSNSILSWEYLLDSLKYICSIKNETLEHSQNMTPFGQVIYCIGLVNPEKLENLNNIKVIKDQNNKEFISTGDTGVVWIDDTKGNGMVFIKDEADSSKAKQNKPIKKILMPMPEENASYAVNTSKVIAEGKNLQSMIVDELPRIGKCIERGFTSSACRNTPVYYLDMSSYTIQVIK